MRLTLKQFLSDSPDETGFIIITASSPRVEDIQECTWYEKGGVEAQVQVGDCSQKVYLSFDVKDDISLEKRIAKLNVMIDNLTLLRNTLPALWEDAKSNVEAYKELNKGNEDEKVSTN